MKILIIGSGVVGQASGKALIANGHKVTFIDISVKIIEELKEQGYLAISELTSEVKADISMFSVSTPSNLDGSVNLVFLKEALREFSDWLALQEDHLVVIRSTVPPGTSRKELLPILKQANRSFKFCYQPEFLRAISAEEDALHPRMIVIGEKDKSSGDMLSRLYGPKVLTFRVKIEEAELAKYVCNLYNATKISFSNEIWNLGEQLGINGNEALRLGFLVAEANWNEHYGAVGGQPYGGSCLPKDTKGLLEFVNRLEIEMPLLRAVIETNNCMENLVSEGRVEKASIKGLNWKKLKSIK